MKKAVLREKLRKEYEKLWEKKAEQILDESIEAQKKVNEYKGIFTDTLPKKVKTANATKIDKNIPYTLTNEKKAGK